MYSTLLPKIKTILEGITRIKQVSMFPKTDIQTFPAVWVNPAGVENTFESSKENMKTYRFDLHVVVGINDAMTQEQAYTVTMPNVIDDIITEFDATWNNGTSLDGHRIWQIIDVAEPWQVLDETDGLTVYAPLSLVVRVLTDV